MLTLIVDSNVSLKLSHRELTLFEAQLGRMVQAATLKAGQAVYEVNCRLCDDTTIRRYNGDFRNIDKATDVLAFAMQESQMAQHLPEMLGDILISVERAEDQRAERTLLQETLFLAAHGLCHLLGYDHQDDAQESEMNQRMEDLLAQADAKGDVVAA